MDIQERIFYRKGYLEGTYYKVDLDKCEIEALGDYEDKKTIVDIEFTDHNVIRIYNDLPAISPKHYDAVHNYLFILTTGSKIDKEYLPYGSNQSV